MTTKPEGKDVGFTNLQRDRMEALRRRQVFLSGRVRAMGGDQPRDRAELSAIEWAIRALEHAAQLGVLRGVN